MRKPRQDAATATLVTAMFAIAAAAGKFTTVTILSMIT
jgi:hypothetical protein